MDLKGIIQGLMSACIKGNTTSVSSQPILMRHVELNLAGLTYVWMDSLCSTTRQEAQR